MHTWRDAQVEDKTALKTFTCFKPRVWAPNTHWKTKKNETEWVQTAQKLVRELSPPAALDEWQLITAPEKLSSVHGVLVFGVDHVELDEVVFTVRVVAKSLEAEGQRVGTSAIELLGERIMMYLDENPEIEHVTLTTSIHEKNLKSKALFEKSGWWPGDLINDPNYRNWHSTHDLGESDNPDNPDDLDDLDDQSLEQLELTVGIDSPL